MPVEQPQRNSGFLKDRLVNSGAFNKMSGPVLRELAKSAAEMFDFQDPNHFIDDFYFLRQGRYPIIILNHQSLADVAVAVGVSDRTNGVGNLPIEYNMPISISVKEQQGSFIKVFYEAVRPWVSAHRIQMYEVARYKDREDYNLPPTEETNAQLQETVRSKKGLIVFMEGETTGGRVDRTTGKIRGMVEVKNRQVPNQIAASINDVKKDVAILPVAVNGGYRILNPDTRMITSDAWKKLAYQKIAFANPKMATAVIGRPLTGADIQRAGIPLDNHAALTTFLMKKIAELLPEEARGFYA